MTGISARTEKPAFIAGLSNITGSLTKSHFYFQEYEDAPSTATLTWRGDSKKRIILCSSHRLRLSVA